MDSNKRGFSLFGNYNLNESETNVPGRQWRDFFCLKWKFYFVLLVHSTPGMNSLSPYLNFDPKVLNPVNRKEYDM